MLVLGLESSCDETGAALISEEGLLADALHSQIDMHRAYGGVVPELASRDHIRRAVRLIDEVLERAGRRREDIDAIAVTEGPGLAGALLVGASVAHAAGWALGIPVIGVHHLEGHLLAARLADPAPEFPFLALLVSGGHTQIMRVESFGRYELLGETLDDAAGEAFDKTAQLLGLPYPGGPAVSELAEKGRSGAIELARPMIHAPNLNMSFSRSFGRHSVYVEGSVIYRDTKDYIQRSIAGLSGNREGAFYENYGRVRTTGGSLSVRYSFGRWLSLGGNFTQMDVKDNERLMVGSQAVANPLYGARMPNVPYRFADADATLSWPGLGGRGNTLSLTYDNAYTHSFSYYSEGVAAVNGSDYIVPRQFAHNLSLAYSIASGRYNVSLECRNLTDANLYDNFSLQKPGRAFYAKVRVSLGG